jgi:hypothetical protein
MEALYLHLGRWGYTDTMPTLPLTPIGLVPLAQWLVLPPIILWLAQRQLRGLKGGR